MFKHNPRKTRKSSKFFENHEEEYNISEYSLVDEDFKCEDDSNFSNCKPKTSKKKCRKNSGNGIKGDKKNVVKNFIKAFRGFLNSCENADTVKSI